MQEKISFFSRIKISHVFPVTIVKINSFDTNLMQLLRVDTFLFFHEIFFIFKWLLHMKNLLFSHVLCFWDFPDLMCIALHNSWFSSHTTNSLVVECGPVSCHWSCYYKLWSLKGFSKDFLYSDVSRNLNGSVVSVTETIIHILF